MMFIHSRHGVLSDKDIWREIRSRNLVTGLPDEAGERRRSVQASSYDLHIGHAITADRHLSTDGETLSLDPGGMAILATREDLNLPPNITGLVVPRDKPAKTGLLILNAGHVDPGHCGFVTAQVINLGKQRFPISVGGSYFSIIFEYLTTSADSPRQAPVPPQARLTELSQQATQLAQSIIEVQKGELEKTLREEFVNRRDFDRELWKRWWVVATVLFGYTVGVAGIVAVVIAALERYT